MEQLTLLEELHDLRGERKSARRAPRGRAPREAGRPCSVEAQVSRSEPKASKDHQDQGAFDFDAQGALARVLAFPTAAARERNAEESYRLGCELEAADPGRARAAYTRALALDPAHADAHLNLGCLDHEAGRLADAEAHYRAALTASAGDVTARFDLAVVLEDQQRADEAREAYLACLSADPACAEAHYNVARLCERAGDLAAALRHLMAYRRIVQGDGLA